MKTSLAIALLLSIMPFIYLGLTWNKIPNIIPIHYNYKGKADQRAKDNNHLPFL